MKKYVLIVCITMCTNFIFAQELEKTQNVHQKLDTNVVENDKNAVSYKLILEGGFSTGIEHFYYKDRYEEKLRTRHSWLGVSLIAINNIDVKDRFLLGIGGGLEYRSILLGIPKELAGTCFFNFRYYFNEPEKIVRPILNIAIGGRITKEFNDDIFRVNDLWRIKYGLYSTFGAGIKIKRFSFHGGVLFWTMDNNLFGVDAMVRAGLIF